MQILRQIKKFSIQVVDSDCSVCMAAIWYSGPISVVPTNEQFFSEKWTGAKFQSDSLKTEGLVCIYTDMAKSTQLIVLIIYV